MRRSKYINTFNTEQQFEQYISSQDAAFPNTATTLDDGKIHYTETKPNNHVIFGKVNNGVTSVWLNFNGDPSYTQGATSIKCTVDTENNTFYLDSLEGVNLPLQSLATFKRYGMQNILSFDIINLDTSNVTSMSAMFDYCQTLNYIDLSSFDTSNVTSMNMMFNICGALTTLDLSSFDTSNVTNMWQMFNGCGALTTLDLSSFDTSNVTNMTNMFSSCNSLTTLDISSFDMSNVLTQFNIFIGCDNLKDVYIGNETTLNKLTNNLSSQGNDYIPASATIHYTNNGQTIDYKWQNNAWTPQNA